MPIAHGSLWLALLFAGGTPALAQQPATIRVTVTHAAAPVAGALVVVAQARATTDAGGMVSLAVPAGPMKLTVTRGGFAPAAIDLEIKPGESREFTVALEKLPDP